ncbi:PDZ and LIM domain protein 7-like isoform X9 [Anneissia japonica]|uniref:PDZ and LIM domain protein 7-like isoform X9 n=1 Tax=Anneissia japonica TaxID=1529436 RepID=UPI0014257EF0|nr:PDZ and LIM domain protein 7-like isoform X9 [Anneissia japonica]
MDRALQVTIQGPGPWGFRLAGGKDFNTPLQISKVTPGGKAAKQNLYPNDIVTAIDGQDTSSMTHLEAQNKIKAASGNLMLNIQRTGEARVWKPTTTRIEPQGVSDGPSFKVSLAANKQESQNIGSKHNVTARPFGAGDAVSPGTATVVHKQFNSPAGLYSASNIAETFKGQTEGLIAGHMLEGEEEPQAVSNPGAQSRSFKMLQQHIGDEVDGPSGMTNGAKPAGMKSVKAPTTNPNAGSKPASSGQLPICFRCQIGIVGPFVNLKGKSLHPDCFVCEACNCSLRNKGYFTVAGKMYCEQDAKAKQIEQQQQKQSPAPAQVAPKSVSNGQGSMKINLSSAAKPAPPVQSYSPQQPQTFSQKPPSVCGIKPVFTVQSKVSHQIPWEKEGPSSPREDQPERIKVMFLPDSGKKSTPSQIAQQSRMAKNAQPKAFSPSPQAYTPSPQAYTPPRQANPPQAPGDPVLPTVPVFRPSQPKAPSGPAAPAPFSTVPRPANPGVPKATPAGTRTPTCEGCGQIIRGPFVSAVGKNWHPEHFVCAHCHEPLQNIGFVEEKGKIYCEKDYTNLYAPKCSKCMKSVAGKCVNALGGQFHPECFVCFHCNQPISGNSFHTNEGKVYCTADYNALFSTTCASCMFAIEPGDEWLEALGTSWHSNCFNCNACQVNLEGHGFYAKNGKPYCPQHA